jgi:hypothetical protein
VKYKHPKHGVIFVACSFNGMFGTFYRKPNGSLKRVVSPDMPMCYRQVDATRNLIEYAKKNKLERAEE